ncbi:hypothetical protein SAMN05216312_108282 [Cohnella sp. OV330]|uniref:fibronectin type III domain-containing protein n=1 Tax=Cohnella sp. OV330 TaxID=1855288 RepID=UPI0008E214AB|nr:fibronectin type III domain-containing protein [Cohnella sp. OV330]SFB45213.1 hypothetical protein SAMN05216312_108282 [Cohnella sp. OV330]
MNRRFTRFVCGFLLLTLLLPFQIAAAEDASGVNAQESSISVTVKELKTDQAATKVKITAAVASLYELEQVQASTSGREVPLTRACASCDWTGEMPLNGLAKGTHTLIVTATDIYDGTGTGTGTFEYDEPPVVTRLEPASNHAVIRDHRLHVIAEAEDDLAQPSFMVQIGEDLRYPDIIESDQGEGKFDREYDVTKYEGDTLNIQYSISDGSLPDGDYNRRVTVNRTVHIESSPELTEVEREPDAQILDADESRLLMIRSGALIIKDRLAGTETELLKGITTDRSNGFKLTPVGAAFLIDTGWYEMKLFWWNGATLASIPVESGSVWQASGNDVAISNFGTLHWIDTQTGTTRDIPYPYDLNFDLEPSGTLLLEPTGTGASSDQIKRYDPRTGTTSTVFEYAGAPRGPVSDGAAILFTLEDGSLMKYLDGTVTEVVHGTTPERLLPHEGYEVKDGWIAYQKANASQVPQLYLQSPGGSVKQASYFNTGTTIRSLDASGTMVIANAGKLYQYSQGTDKPTPIAGGAGIVRWIDHQLHYLLGETIFTVKAQAPSDTEAPTWPQGDVLTFSQATFNGVKLNWQPAADEEGVVKYLLYQNNKLLSTLEGSVNSYEAQGLSPKTSYLFSLVAVDAAGNHSLEKNVTVTTVKPTPKPETLLYRFNGTILDFDQNHIVWKQTGDHVLWLFNRIDKSQVKVYDAAGADRTIINAALSVEGIVYTLESSGSAMTYLWKNGTVIEQPEGQTQYETRGIPEGMFMYTLYGTTYLYTREGELIYTFSGPGKLEYREQSYIGPGENPYRIDAWYRVYGGSLYIVRM